MKNVMMVNMGKRGFFYIGRRLTGLLILLMLCSAVSAVEPKIVAGDGFFLLLASDGSVWSWGRNDYGQLGIGSADGGVHATPVRVSFPTAVIDIAAGSSHALALGNNGLIYGWGRNHQGQTGTGDTGTNHATPTSTGYSAFIALAAGGDHSVALYATGQIYCWGDNGSGQLGIAAGDFSDRSFPTAANNASLDYRVIAIAAGLSHTMALRADGTVWTWGSDGLGQLGEGITAVPSQIPIQVTGVASVKDIAAGSNHCLALLTDGTMRTWGSNNHGQCGFPTSNLIYFTPQAPSYGWKVRRVYAGGDHSAAIEEYGWFVRAGANASGELATGGTADLTAFGYTASGTKAVALGTDATLLLSADGEVQSCGTNTFGQLGNGSATPSIILGSCTATWPMHQAIAIAAHGSGGLILKADGTVWSWGYDGSGQLGNDSDLESQYQPVQVSGLSRIIAIAAGSSHCLALRNDGTVLSWGDDGLGQLGDDASFTNQPKPVQVANSGFNAACAISAGYYHSGLVSSSGVAYTWGQDFYGQLGNDSSNTSQATPVPVSGMTDAKALACGGYHTLALKGNGSVWSWGYDNEGELGNGANSDNQYTPVPVAVLSGGASAIAAGTYHSGVIQARLRALYTWGYNWYGQLGLGDSGPGTNRNIPTLVGSYWTDLRMGGTHTLVLNYNNYAYACGADDSGQLGDDVAFSFKQEPTYVPGPSIPVALAAGGSSSFALQANGTVQAWGSGSKGSLGNNDTRDQPTPVETDRFWLPLVQVSASDDLADESGGDIGVWKISADRLSPGAVLITFSLSGSATLGGADPDYSVVAATSASIRAGGYSADVVLTPVDDLIAENDEDVTLTIAANPVQYRLDTTMAAKITIGDNDEASIIVSAVSGSTTEAGGTASFNIRLGTKPLFPVTIGLSNPRPDEGVLSTASVILNASNWVTGITVTVTGVDDDLDDNDATYTISTNTASSSDGKYNNINPTDVSVTNNDNDVSSFQMTGLVGRATEAYGGTRYAVTSFINSSRIVQCAGAADLGPTQAMVGQWIRFLSGPNQESWARIAAIDDVNDRLTLDRSLVANDGAGFVALIPCFGVRLTCRPQSSVSLSFDVEDTAELSVFPGSLTFDPDNTMSQIWSAYQIVSVYGQNEFLDDGDKIRKVITNAATSGDSKYNGINPPERSVTNVDDDVSALVISAAAVSVTEGLGSKTYTVALACQPLADVTVTLTSVALGSVITVDTDTSTVGNQTAMTFTAGNWNTARQVTVTAFNDPDIELATSVTITHTATAPSDTNYHNLTAVKSITVNSEDAVGIVINPVTAVGTPLTVPEGSKASFQVRLAARPANDKKVRLVFALSGAATGHATISSGSEWVWGYGDWDTLRNVEISGTEEGDSANEAFTLNMTVTDNAPNTDNDANFYTFAGAWTQSQPNVGYAQTIDNDIPGIAITEVNFADTNSIDGATVLSESGTADRYKVSLNTIPAGGSVIVVALTPDAQVTVDKSFLVFTSADWNVGQVVTASAVNDARLESATHAGTIQHAVSFSTDLANYPTTITRSLGIQIQDNDTAGVVISPLSVITTENGGTSTFAVVLNAQPAVGKTVRVKLDYQGPVPAEAQLDVSAVTGGGSSDGQTAWIDFTESDWSQVRTVVVRGLDDDIDDGDQPFTIVTAIGSTGTADPAFDNLDPEDVQGSNIDVNAVGVLLWEAGSDITVGQLAITEDAMDTPSATYRVRLASKPTAPITVTFQPDSQVTVAPAILTFNPTGGSLWDAPQVVTVTAVDDAIAEVAEHFGSLTATASGGDYSGITIANVTAKIADDDNASIIVGSVSGPVPESGPALIGPQGAASATTVSGFMVQMPDGSNLSGLYAGQWLHFTAGANNGVYTQIAPSGIDDAADRLTVTTQLSADANAPFSVLNAIMLATTVTAAGNLVEFSAGISLSNLFVGQYLQFVGNGANNGTVVQVATIDDANDRITVTGTLVNATNELVIFFAGFTVTLSSQPTSTVDIDTRTGSAADLSVFPARLTFSPLNWNQPQVVSFFGVNNDVDDGNRTPLVILQPALSADPYYNGYDPTDPTVTVLDDDERRLLISTPHVPLLVDEDGGLDTFTVRLASRPTADVTLAVTVSDAQQISVSTASLVFTSSNWQTPQTVTVTGLDGDGVDNGAGTAATVGLAIDTTSDARYASLDASTVAVTNAASNAAPTLDAIADLTVVQNGGPVVVALAGITAGQTGENAVQTLTITASSNPASLLGVPVVTYTTPAATGSLSIPLVANAFGKGTVTVTVTDDNLIDGEVRSIQQTFSITVAAVLVDLNGTAAGFSGDGVVYNEGEAAKVLVPLANVDSSRSLNLSGMTVSLSPIPDGADEVLAVKVAETSLASVYDAGSGVLTITGPALPAVYQEVLRSLTYINHQERPTFVARTVTIQASDNLTTSLVATVALNVVPVNDRPKITGTLKVLVPFNNIEVITGAMLGASDVDHDLVNMVFSLVTAPNQGTMSRNNVAMEVGATFTVADITGGLLSYRHSGVGTSDDVFAVRVNDGLDSSDLEIFAIDVTSSEAPTMVATTIALACNRPRSVVLPIVDPQGRQVTMSVLPPIATKGVLTIGAPGSNTVTYEPDLDVVGDDSFGLHLVNTHGDVTDVTVQVHITDPAEAQPSIISVSPMVVREGDRFYYVPAVDRGGLTGGTLSWELTAPAGPNFSATTGVINWLPVTVPGDGSGYHQFHLLVVDDVNHVAGYQPILFQVEPLPAIVPAPGAPQ